jgi:hypothetical protein
MAKTSDVFLGAARIARRFLSSTAKRPTFPFKHAQTSDVFFGCRENRQTIFEEMAKTSDVFVPVKRSV